MTNPIFQALVAGRLQQVNSAEAVIGEEVSAALGPLPPDTHRPERFIKWCSDQNLPWRPASPAVCAKFVLDHAKLGNLLEEIRLLSQAHCELNLPDPTAAWVVTEALLRLIKVETPRSWPAPERVIFLSLPPDLQRYLILREKDREVIFRTAQTEAALRRKHLAETEKSKEKTDGPTEIQPTEASAA